MILPNGRSLNGFGALGFLKYPQRQLSGLWMLVLSCFVTFHPTCDAPLDHIDLQEIVGTSKAFAAILTDGSVRTWGHQDKGLGLRTADSCWKTTSFLLEWHSQPEGIVVGYEP